MEFIQRSDLNRHSEEEALWKRALTRGLGYLFL